MENRYDKYKDSGIAWIGEIPEHWEVCSIKQIMKNKSIKGFPNETVLSLYRDLGVIPKDSREDNHNVTSEDTSNYKFVEEGDFVINKMKAWQGSMAISDYKGIVSPAYYVCKVINSKVDKKYIHYLLRNESYKVEYMRLSTGMRIGQWDLNINDFLQINTIIPSVLEQQSIAAYLDQKCGEIDELITLQEEMITKLQSYKQSVITEAVTKGLDKNVPLKDSGVEWIGMIPEHWEVKRLKNLGYLYGGLTGKTGNDFNVEEGDNYEYFIPFTNIFNNMYVDMNLLGKVKVSPNEKQNKVIKNDILFLMSSEDYDGIGKSSLCKENHPHPLYLNSFCKGLRVENKFKSIFLNYFMNSAVGKYFCQIASNGFIRINLRQDKLLACPILCPPLPEQQSIADYLDQRCGEIDELISIKQQKIEKLKEYKKSLIFECVTGKRKVS